MAELHTPYGRALEDFEIGDTIHHWPGRTITQADDHLFSLLALNQHPLHSDAHYASQTQFGRNVVNGTLVFSVGVGLTVNDISGAAIANLEYENIEHLKPTFHGDTLYSRTTILDKKESTSKPDRGVVYVETTVRNQREEDVMRFRRRLMVPKAAFAPRPYTHKKQQEEK